jgi:hypothetical protein
VKTGNGNLNLLKNKFIAAFFERKESSRKMDRKKYEKNLAIARYSYRPPAEIENVFSRRNDYYGLDVLHV